MYAHFVFNVFDQDGDGTVSFEVCLIKENDSKCVLDNQKLMLNYLINAAMVCCVF